MIVSEMPGTTRDAVDTMLHWHRRQFRIVDTAGIRRPGRVARGGQVESVSVLLARRAIRTADIVVLVVDAARARPIRTPPSPARPTGRARHHHRGQQMGPDEGRGPDFVKEFDGAASQLKFLDYAPMLHISALTASGRRSCSKPSIAWPTLATAAHADAGAQHVRRSDHGRPSAGQPGPRHVRILYAAQTGVAPPTFVLLHQRGDGVPLLVRAVSANNAAGGVRLRGHAIRLHVARAGERDRARPAGEPAAGHRAMDEPDASTGCYTVADDRRSCTRPRRSVKAAGLQPYVLRSWEKEIPGIGVQKSQDSPRLYRQSDIDQVLRIKQLVFGEGLTLSGARRRLEETSPGEPDAGDAESRRGPRDAGRRCTRTGIANVRQGLRSILSVLSNAPGHGAWSSTTSMRSSPPAQRAHSIGGREAEAVPSAAAAKCRIANKRKRSGQEPGRRQEKRARA